MSGKTLAGGDVDVAIIGAGAAGVGAARRLQSLRPDLSLLLLEASERIGGRARTVNHDKLEMALESARAILQDRRDVFNALIRALFDAQALNGDLVMNILSSGSGDRV
jgi:protoporphyrinogen oxidase